MGYSISGCAVREEGADRLIGKLGLTATGETEELPESPIACGRLDTGWIVIWCNEYECSLLAPGTLAILSLDQDVIVCRVEEHVMVSSAEWWSAGKRKWWIARREATATKRKWWAFRRTVEAPEPLSADGDLPGNFQQVRKEMEELQRAQGAERVRADYIFEIPLRVAKSLVGFKHDESCSHLVGGCFAVMARSPLAKPSRP